MRRSVRKYGNLAGSVVMMTPLIYAGAEAAQFGLANGIQHVPTRALYTLTGYDAVNGTFNSGKLQAAAMGVGVSFLAGKAIKYIVKRA